jgi:Right handed beta helix region
VEGGYTVRMNLRATSRTYRTYPPWLCIAALSSVGCSRSVKDPSASNGTGDGTNDPNNPGGSGSGTDTNGMPTVTKNYAISGTVTGLTALGLTLTNNGGDVLEIEGNGRFFFTTRLREGATYAVAIGTQARKQVCTLLGANGTVTTQDVEDITVTCVAGYTVGGTVSGLESGASVTLANNGEMLTLSANGAFTFPSSLLDTQAYAVTLTAKTSAAECNLLGSDKTDGAVCCGTGAQSAFANAGNWNSYYRFARNNLNVLVPTACTGQETGHYARCVHGGERKSVDIPGLTECVASASDELQAFDWECEITPTQVVRYSTRGLKAGKGLADLIDFDAGTFKDNRLVINSGSGLIRSALGKWWTNPIVVDSAGTTDTPGTIYAFKTNPARTFTVSAAGVGVSLVLAPGVTATGTSQSAETLVSVTDAPFVWIEGTFSGENTDADGIVLRSSRFSVVHRTNVHALTGRGVWLNTTRGTLLRDVNVANAADEGIAYDTSAFSTLRRVSVTYSGRNASKDAVRLTSSNNPFIERLFITNQTATAGASLRLQSIAGGVLDQVTIGQSQGSALLFNSVEDTDVFALSVHDNAAAGVVLQGTLVRNRFSNALISRNATGMSDATATTSAELFDAAFISNTGTGIAYTGGGSEGARGGTLIVGGNGTPCTGVSCPSATPVSASPFFGTFGSAASVTSWFGPFANSLQAWGTETSAACTASACFTKDFSLVSADSLVRGVVSAPANTDTVFHRFLPTIAGAQACTEQFPGSSLEPATGRCKVTALRASVEISDDAFGNDNGLCETFERCLFLQNIASDPGYGDVTTQTLATPSSSTDTAIPVQYLRFSQNGR